MKEWLYYKLYASEGEERYLNILRNIIQPFITNNQERIEHFFFFQYEEKYKFSPDEGCERKFKDGEEVFFLRLRVLAEKEDIPRLENALLETINVNRCVIKAEKCRYDIIADLGVRFDKERIQLIVNYLESACRIALSMIHDKIDCEKNVALLHLASNILYSPLLKYQCQHCNSENVIKI